MSGAPPSDAPPQSRCGNRVRHEHRHAALARSRGRHRPDPGRDGVGREVGEPDGGGPVGDPGLDEGAPRVGAVGPDPVEHLGVGVPVQARGGGRHGPPGGRPRSGLRLLLRGLRIRRGGRRARRGRGGCRGRYGRQRKQAGRPRHPGPRHIAALKPVERRHHPGDRADRRDQRRGRRHGPPAGRASALGATLGQSLRT